MSDVVIRVENLCKEYRLGTISHGTLYRDLQSGWAKFRGKEDPNTKIGSINREQLNSINDRFCALKDISFDVRHGEVLGIIGRNGAGKSTLLKIISRVTAPTKGTIKIKGRVASLLEVGTGFHPELSGRENIFLNGAILGMHKGEIEQKFDEIVKFSEVDKFIDTPVKRYSSGMYVRLAFAVAAHLEPEILVVDEVLAVGDAGFQKKCLGKMGDVAKEGRTVLFVSHNMGAIRNLCKKCILLEEGRINRIGDIDEVVEQYLVTNNSLNDEKDLSERKDRSGSGNVRAIKFFARDGNNYSSELRSMSCVEFVVEYIAKENKPIPRLLVLIKVSNPYGNIIFSCCTNMQNLDFYNLPSKGSVVCRMEELPLIPGKYSVEIKFKDIYGLSDHVLNAGSFVVGGFGDKNIIIYPPPEWGNCILLHSWSILNKDV